MARRLTTKQLLLLIAGGVIAAEVWVGLFGLWAVYDTPLVKLGFTVGLGVPAVAWISMSLFALASAIMFTLPLRIFFRRGFLAAAAVFIVAFLAAFVVPAVFDSEPVSLLASLSNVWLFLVCFGVCVYFVTVFRHA